MAGDTTITITHNTPEVVAQLGKLPGVVGQEVGRALDTGAALVAREARDRAPKANTELANATQPERISLLEWHVRAAKQYASYQEDGSGPGGRPSLSRMLQWMGRKGITPRNPDMTRRGLAHLLRRRIAENGVTAQPFMRPALEANRGRLDELFRAAVTRGLGAITQGRAL